MLGGVGGQAAEGHVDHLAHLFLVLAQSAADREAVDAGGRDRLGGLPAQVLVRAALDDAEDGLAADAPKHLLGIGEPDDLVEGIARGIDSFDCAVPTRLGRHGMALAPLPEKRFRYDVRRRANQREPGPLVDGCPCPACSQFSRAYVHYLSRAEELTGVRLITLHNLVYVQELVAGARRAILAGEMGAYREAIMGGSAPWEVG